MLVARRDPFHPGAHDAPYAHDAAGGGTPRLARTVSMLQMVGSLLAIPVGLASAYSIYRANFSVETTCQSLRADIISMIDKSVDASTRRMLVRRDVEKFEQTCGSIDPDATAAFKSLLATEKPPSTAAPARRAGRRAGSRSRPAKRRGPQGRAASADGRQNAGRNGPAPSAVRREPGVIGYAMARCRPPGFGDA